MIKSIQRVKEIISVFRGKKVAVIGDLMLDVHIRGKAERISQEAPVPVVRVKNTSSSLGGAANVMKNLAVYGTKVYAYGIVGEDEDGIEIKRQLSANNIDIEGVFSIEGRSTIRKERVIASSQQLLRIDYEDTSEPPSENVKAVLNKLTEKINDGIDAVIIEDYAKGMISKTLIQNIIKRTKAKKIICALDPHPSHPFNVKGISFMTPNRAEANALAGIIQVDEHCRGQSSEDRTLQMAARSLMQKWCPEELIITLGPDGMALFKGKSGTPLIIPTKAREVFDVSGAGDTVIALYTLAKCAGASSEEAAEIANHAAGVVVGKIGAATASEEEILESFKFEGLN